MSDQTPPQDFDSQNYARPNQRWLCGRLSEGKPCEIGPDGRGRCQATAECVPSMELKAGETKGRWRCNRSAGACESGPMPDGSCGRPIPRCAPVPTLRTVRGRVTFAVIAATCGALLILLGYPPARSAFINPGPLSRAHSAPSFGSMHSNTGSIACVECHAAASAGPNGVVKAALAANPNPWKFSRLLLGSDERASRMDIACLKCHSGHDFHQPNTTQQVACSVCHNEHQGTMAAVTDAECGRCHASGSAMASAATKSGQLPAKSFDRPPSRTTFISARPAGGFTRVIHHFADDHPEFRVLAEKTADPDTLRFNHRLHLTSDTIRSLPNGQKLECATCHQPDQSGVLMQPVAFANHCQVCHSLQFDPETPSLTLPHGNAEFVSSFLHSLSRQYLEVARQAGINDGAGQQKFVDQKLARLRAQTGPGEGLEHRVFFSTATLALPVSSGSVNGPAHSLYPGCAYCHQVQGAVEGRPQITPPVQIGRWLAHGRFDHNRHTTISCAKCHPAASSSETADVLLTSKKVCAECHSPQGGVADSCVTCHHYHNTPPGGASPLKTATSAGNFPRSD